MAKAKPKRRWYQFSLRMMFAGMMLVCIGFGWAGYSLNWIRERHRRLGMVVALDPEDDWVAEEMVWQSDIPVRAPWGLWLFGENGISSLAYVGPAEKIDEAKRLFPEARIDFVGPLRHSPK